MTLCVVDGKQCNCQPDEGCYCDRVADLKRELAETKERCVMWAESKGKILAMYENVLAELNALKNQTCKRIK